MLQSFHYQPSTYRPINVTNETICERYKRYINDSFRDGVIGRDRYCQYMGKARRLQRFLCIIGQPNISANEFDINMLMTFRKFVTDEYLYVKKYRNLYPEHNRSRHRYPTKQMSNNSVVHEMKALKAFFSELENTDEILKSPFRRLSNEKRRIMMHVMYNEPFFLRAEEFQKVVDTQVDESLQEVKDRFVLNCCLGCRIGDFFHLSMDKIAVSPEGIPYIHYFPSKTKKLQLTNREIQTPLVMTAFEIIARTRFAFNHGNQRYHTKLYNQKLPQLLELCGINRKVCIYDHELNDNVYVPLYSVATSRLARKTHVDMMNKVQVNIYAAGLHSLNSNAVNRYTNLELADRFALMNVAFAQKPYKTDENLNIIDI